MYVRELFYARNKSVSLLIFSRTEVYHIKSTYFGLTFFWFLRSPAHTPTSLPKVGYWQRIQSMKEKSQCSRSELRFSHLKTVTGTSHLSSHHPTISLCDPFPWPDRLGENTSLCLTHVAMNFYIPCTAPLELVIVDGWSSRFAAGRNLAPLPHHSSPSLNGNESEALDTASVNLTNVFQLVNTRQKHSLYLPVSSWMIHLRK